MNPVINGGITVYVLKWAYQEKKAQAIASQYKSLVYRGVYGEPIYFNWETEVDYFRGLFEEQIAEDLDKHIPQEYVNFCYTLKNPNVWGLYFKKHGGVAGEPAFGTVLTHVARIVLGNKAIK